MTKFKTVYIPMKKELHDRLRIIAKRNEIKPNQQARIFIKQGILGEESRQDKTIYQPI